MFGARARRGRRLEDIDRATAPSPRARLGDVALALEGAADRQGQILLHTVPKAVAHILAVALAPLFVPVYAMVGGAHDCFR